MQDYRPRIGITMRLELNTEHFYLSRYYSEAIEAAGGVPVHISLIPDPRYVSSVIESMDGILLPGSDSDVDPIRYGHEPHQELGDVHQVKDETDLLILSEVEKHRLPLLGICFRHAGPECIPRWYADSRTSNRSCRVRLSTSKDHRENVRRIESNSWKEAYWRL